MYKLNIGEVKNFDGIPVLELHVEDCDRKVVVNTVYLSPFRGYCFQVSATLKGEGDCGSTNVVGLGNIIHAKFDRVDGFSGRSNVPMNEMGREMLLWGMSRAVLKFCNIQNVVPCSIQDSFLRPTVQQFLDMTIEFLNS